MNVDEVVFLKLGGSLITDKTQPYTPRLDKLAELVGEIGSFLSGNPEFRLVLGHGSGSFGHYAVKDHLQPGAFPGAARARSADGARRYWQGFSEVWYRASQLNRLVMEALHAAGIPAIALPPSALTGSSNGAIAKWDLTSLRSSLDAGILPVVYGDIVFDDVSGGAILSTERLMVYLAQHLLPHRILLAGLEQAVWADFPARVLKVQEITPGTYDKLSRRVGGSHGSDVTGGMSSKVEEMLRIVQEIPNLTVQIFSGDQTGNLKRALGGEALGTLLRGD